MKRCKGDAGQGLVEFAVAIPVFLILLMGVVDFGMAIYRFNGVSQAAREIARAASVHPCSGTSPCDPSVKPYSAAVTDVIAIQKALIPDLVVTKISCVDATGATTSPCDFSKDSVNVVVTAAYSPITPILGLVGTWTMKGSSSAQIQ